MGWLLKLGIALIAAAMLWLWLQRLLRGSSAAMDPDEARRLLGVDADADAGAVRDAHRRLIARVHPDAGGSAELAARVNRARDALLAELNRGPPRAS